jgi:hypothetical protein
MKRQEETMRHSVKMMALLTVFSLVAAACSAGPLDVLKFGLRGGNYTDNSDFFLGADAQFHVLMFTADPSVEYVFVEGGDLLTVNADALLNVLNFPMVSGWLGAGIGFMHFRPEGGDSSTDPLFNLIAGAGLGVPLSPYVMAKWVFADSNDGFAIAVGVYF